MQGGFISRKGAMAAANLAAKEFSRAPRLPLLFLRVVIARFCFITFAVRQFSSSSELIVPAFHTIGGKPLLTGR